MRAMRRPIKKIVLTILAIFLFPLAVHGALYFVQSRPQSYDRADWSSTGMLPVADADHAARLLIFTGRTGRWKGIFAVHSWVVFKPENAAGWNRYDVVGWGQPVRNNGWAPDGRWYGDAPRVLLDVRGPQAAAVSSETTSGASRIDFTKWRGCEIIASEDERTRSRRGRRRSARRARDQRSIGDDRASPSHRDRHGRSGRGRSRRAED